MTTTEAIRVLKSMQTALLRDRAAVQSMLPQTGRGHPGLSGVVNALTETIEALDTAIADVQTLSLDQQ